MAILIISVALPALAFGSGETSARRYAAASAMTLHAMSQHILESEASVRELVASIRTRCPGVLAQAPSNQQSNVLRQEIAIAIVLAFLAPDRNYIRRFLATVGRISWSDGRIEALVDKSDAEGWRLVTSTTPNVCHDLTTWTNGQYKTVAPTTTTLTRGLGSAIGFVLLEGNVAVRGHLLTLIEATSSRTELFVQPLKIRRTLRRALLRLGSRSTRAIYAAVGWT
jgi:hypothetical protein